jgi:ABC-type sugar transport system ATPase subunit
MEVTMQDLLTVSGISKHYGSTQALKNVFLNVPQGKVLGLAGENGAGKSTLIKILCGALNPDSGEMRYAGASYKPHDVSDAETKGISVFHQEIPICPHLSIAANVFLGPAIPSSHGAPDWRLMNRRCVELYKTFLDEEIDPSVPIGSCSAAEQQLALLVRVLSRNAKLVVLDEPTTALAAPEVARLFASITRLKEEKSITFIFVSHLLDELIELSDQISVLRDGENVGNLEKKEFSATNLSSLIAGRTITTIKSTRIEMEKTPVCLEAKSLSLTGQFEDISFAVRKGEVFGIAGLQGSGRSALALSLFGAPPPDSGSIFINGVEVRRMNVGTAMKSGIGYLPEDRKSMGIFPNMDITRNIGMAVIGRSRGFSPYDRKNGIRLATTMAGELSIKMSNPSNSISSLSGGNQQKAMLARWLALSPSILVLNEPTRGVDVGAKSEIAEIIASRATQGYTIVVASSEMDELLLLCDRILVLSRGRNKAILEGKTLTKEALFLAAMS